MVDGLRCEVEQLVHGSHVATDSSDEIEQRSRTFAKACGGVALQALRKESLDARNFGYVLRSVSKPRSAVDSCPSRGPGRRRLTKAASYGWGLPTACAPAHSGDGDGELSCQKKNLSPYVARSAAHRNDSMSSGPPSRCTVSMSLRASVCLKPMFVSAPNACWATSMPPGLKPFP
jgi:hypothetical protein